MGTGQPAFHGQRGSPVSDGSLAKIMAVGGEPLQFNQLTEAELDELASARPTLTYGNATKPAPVEFVPAHVAFDKKVRSKDSDWIQEIKLLFSILPAGSEVQCFLQADSA